MEDVESRDRACRRGHRPAVAHLEGAARRRPAAAVSTCGSWNDRAPALNRCSRVFRLTLTLLLASAFSPATAQILIGDGTITCGSPYDVANGDTLSRLAERAYGDPMLYGVIAEANAAALGGDPENLLIGMVLEVPCVDTDGNVLTAEEAQAVAASLQAVIAAEGPLSGEELETLFGPVALFPDPLLTPVLVAVTFPLDVVKAARFVEEMDAAPDEARVAAAADQPWDDSVRELAAGFPDLVVRMSDHVDWTEQAGEAVVAQTDAALAAIQRLRAKAQENGYLVDNEVQNVEADGDTIVIAPADPNVIYVPTYDSQVVYTQPVVGPPVYHYGYDYYDSSVDWGDALVTGGIILGGAIILDEIFDDDDWDGWDNDDDIDWDRGDITIDRGDIDIDIDRDEISIGDGDRVSIGDGERPRIGDGARVSIGDSERVQIDRDALGDRFEGGSRASISSGAGREAARERIQSRQALGVQPATLGATRREPAVARGGTARPRAEPATIDRSRQISRPSTDRKPSVRSPSRSSSAFRKPSGSHRASAASSRGRSSMGKRGGRGGGGGGKRR